MKDSIIDCDNTFGVAGCDVDHGLAILSALGSGKCRSCRQCSGTDKPPHAVR